MTDLITEEPPVLACDRRRMLRLVHALENGSYVRGPGHLRRTVPDSGTMRWCCAGVACDLSIADGIGAWEPPALGNFTWTFVDAGFNRDDEDHVSSAFMTDGAAGWLGLEEPDDPAWSDDQLRRSSLRLYVPPGLHEDTAFAQDLRVGTKATGVDMNDSDVPFTEIARAFRYSYLRPDLTRRMGRHDELWEMRKQGLARLYREGGYVASAHPPETWLKGELIEGILDWEFFDGWQDGSYTPASVA